MWITPSCIKYTHAKLNENTYRYNRQTEYFPRSRLGYNKFTRKFKLRHTVFKQCIIIIVLPRFVLTFSYHFWTIRLYLYNYTIYLQCKNKIEKREKNTFTANGRVKNKLYFFIVLSVFKKAPYIKCECSKYILSAREVHMNMLAVSFTYIFASKTNTATNENR